MKTKQEFIELLNQMFLVLKSIGCGTITENDCFCCTLKDKLKKEDYQKLMDLGNAYDAKDQIFSGSPNKILFGEIKKHLTELEIGEGEWLRSISINQNNVISFGIVSHRRAGITLPS